MTTVSKFWTFAKLPEDAQKALVVLHVAQPGYQYERGETTLTLSFENYNNDPIEIMPATITVAWATDNYEEKGKKASDLIAVEDLHLIRPRVEKSKEEQKRRVKQKAEVFTPAWVVCLQNNLVDDEVLGVENAFATVKQEEKNWVGTREPIVFSESYPWWQFVAERRLEMCCGEAPYLFTPYEATTGIYIPVIADGEWRRVGVLDRKLRVVSEQADSLEEWLEAGKLALKTVYGFEWQGDNLMLARLNMVNTFFDYLRAYCDTKGERMPTKATLNKLVVEIAEIVAWQLWQMDGLKMVLPESCSSSCSACKDKKKRFAHDGRKPILKWGTEKRSFEQFLVDNQAS